MKNLVKITTDASIGVQIITTVVGFLGLLKSIPPEHLILQKILELEIGVQVVELLFYIIFVRGSVLSNMAEVRYFDWLITTPIMLITSAIYYKYEEYLYKKKNTKVLKLTEILNTNKSAITVIVLFNFLMLLFGFLGEKKLMTKFSSTFGGFVFFFISFYTLYDKFAKHSPIGTNLYLLMFIIWNMYGVAFLFTPTWKNITFNGLDIIAKNFFGIYLYYKILTV